MNNLVDFIQLINTENIGPVTFYKLIDKFGSAAEALKNLPPKYKLFPRSKAKLELDLAKSKNIHILSYQDEAYPSALRQLADAPPILYVKGKIELLNHELAIAIVGSRHASINGRKTISKLAYELTNNEILIISGMARGIDTAAHKGAMYAKEQTGPTIAVLGCGVDVVYPLENKVLYEQICQQGIVLSEFPIGTEPQPQNFPRRNRIVAALSIGTLVGEASINSGSLITARLALEQGKDIYAIPASPSDSRSNGSNKLIKEGAILVDSVEDILNSITISNNKKIKPFEAYAQQELFVKPIDKSEKSVNIRQIYEHKDIISFITPEGVDKDEIIRESGLSASEVSMQLMDLELSGIIEKRVGNKVALVSRKKR
ncbi:MAG: DNA-processing protein DprA [Alphaproteobacteria bacterium]|nr:DNA-processing protein DprA [Alphaproteobacteria bacterium]